MTKKSILVLALALLSTLTALAGPPLKAGEKDRTLVDAADRS